jgi:hypothetical protein
LEESSLPDRMLLFVDRIRRNLMILDRQKL